MKTRFKLYFVLAALLAGLWMSPALAADEQPPSEDMLEFLADWQTENGDYVAPEALDEMALTEQEQTTDEN